MPILSAAYAQLASIRRALLPLAMALILTFLATQPAAYGAGGEGGYRRQLELALEPHRVLGSAANITPAAWLATSDDRTTDVLVLLKDQVDASSVAAHVPPSQRGAVIVDALQQTAVGAQASLRTWLAHRHIAYRAFYIVNALLVTVDRAQLAAVAARPDVSHVMANPQVALSLPPRPVQTAMTSNVPWGSAQIGAPEVWDLGYQGQGVVVAGQDTGYDWDHPALQAQYRGWDGANADHDYHWHDAIHAGGGICGPDSPVPCDDNGHGTHTMGTIVGDGGVNYRIGVAPQAQWIGCRNMSQGFGTPATYAECFEFFLAPYPVGGTPSEGDPQQAPDIINNSWSCPPYEGCDAANIAFLQQVVENVRAAGILVVASAGNRGPACGTVDQPAGMYEATFTVGATGSGDTIAGFSSRGTGTGLIKPDIVAPGVTVLSSLAGGGYGTKSGTSMAAPHVAGAAALLWSARPDLRREITATETVLSANALALTSTWCGDAINAVPNNVYGWGRLDAQAAVESALKGSLVGTVRDGAGVALEGAVLHTALGDTYSWQSVSGIDGRYAMEPLSGTYTLTASYGQLAPQSFADINISAGFTTTLDITLTRTYPVFLPVVFEPPGS